MTPLDIERFLIKCKIATKSNFIFNYNNKNKCTLEEFGYQIDDIVAEIMDLQVVNYAKGPCKDNDGYAGDYWVFKKVILGKEIYIKVKIKDLDFDGNKQLTCYCASFHF